MTPLPLSAFDIAPEEFHRRQAWARAGGHGPWLWPEIGFEAWRAAREAITRATAETLIHGQASAPLAGDPEVMSLAAYTAGLGPLLGWWIAEGRVAAAEPVAAVFDLHLRHNRMRAGQMLAHASSVVRRLAGAGIAVTVLKGMHTSLAYFPDPATRPASDIDLLVSPQDAARASGSFAEQGFLLEHETPREKSWRAPGAAEVPRALLLVHAEDPWSIDLHNSLDYRPRLSVPPAHLDRVVAGAQILAWPGDPAGRVLAQPALLLHLAVHLSYSLVNLTPLRMAELALVIRQDRASGALDWSEFLAAAAQAGAVGIVFPALHFTERLVPGTVPAEILAASAAAAPRALRRHLERRSPATAQRMARITLEQHFMWADGWRAQGSQLLRDLTLAVSARGSQNRYWLHAAQLLKPRRFR